MKGDFESGRDGGGWIGEGYKEQEKEIYECGGCHRGVAWKGLHEGSLDKGVTLGSE
jgi:hypothetical protein